MQILLGLYSFPEFWPLLKKRAPTTGLILVQNMEGHENGPMAQVPNQDFNWPFEILMGRLEKKDGPKKP